MGSHARIFRASATLHTGEYDIAFLQPHDGRDVLNQCRYSAKHSLYKIVPMASPDRKSYLKSMSSVVPSCTVFPSTYNRFSCSSKLVLHRRCFSNIILTLSHSLRLSGSAIADFSIKSLFRRTFIFLAVDCL